MTIETIEIGELTAGYGTPTERKIPIENRAAFSFADDRVISICKLQNNEGYYIEVARVPQSDIPINSMWLSEISFMGLITSLNLFTIASNINIHDNVDSFIGSVNFDYKIEGIGLIDPFNDNKSQQHDHRHH
jgi:hypothetical protein